MTDLPLDSAILIAIFFFAAFGQTISGFGFALMGMPLATLVVGTQTAAPLVALAGLTLYSINLLRYRASINLREVSRLGIVAALGVPIGIWGLVTLDESLVKCILGSILIGYAIFSFVRPTTTLILSHRWSYLAGFITGCLGGAYNLPGPPLIVYGTLRKWERDEFRAILQSLFFLTGSLTVVSHFLTNHITSNILTLYAWSVLAILSGVGLGAIIDRRIQHELFRLIVIAMIFILGLTMILGVR